MNRYQFNKAEHVHTLDDKPLIGTSGVSSVISKPLSYWASGLAVKTLGIPDPKVLTKLKHKKHTPKDYDELVLSASQVQQEIREMSVEKYIKLLDCAYRAHATTLVERRLS